MANHASAEKRNRQRVKRTIRNRAVKSAVRTVVKKARTARHERRTHALRVKGAERQMGRSLRRRRRGSECERDGAGPTAEGREPRAGNAKTTRASGSCVVSEFPHSSRERERGHETWRPQGDSNPC